VLSLRLFTPQVVFFRYAVSKEEIQIGESKIKVTKSCSILTTIMKVCSFHGLASFYYRFIKDFSSIVAPLIECTKKGSLKWTKAA